MRPMGLIIERSLSESAQSGVTSGDTLNLVFILAFALFISYLAMVIARRGGKRK